MKIQKVNIRRFKGIEDIHLDNLEEINSFYGRNNSGKSTMLHAFQMASLALTVNNWGAFQPKLEIKDMFQETGPFEMDIIYSDGSNITIRQQEGGGGPTMDPTPTSDQKFKSIYIVPDPGIGLLRRQSQTPYSIMKQFKANNFSNINGLDILFALKFYSEKRMNGFQPEDYNNVIDDVMRFFPELEEIVSNRTEMDIATINYREYGKILDVVYAGTGLKHFIDIFVKVTLSQASVVLIDEPEMGLHPNLQREMLNFIYELAQNKGIQFFFATHSPVFLTDIDKINVFRIQNCSGKRSASTVSKEFLHTIWGDLGLRPGDLLQNDIVILVEGQADIIFFEEIINGLYHEEFKDIAIGIVQYGGSAADGIISGKIKIENIVSGKSDRLWIRDRDASPSNNPSPNNIKFRNALEKHGENCHILEKREIEFYFPEIVCVDAQNGDVDKEEAIKKALMGKQEIKFTKLAKYEDNPFTVPNGRNLQKLLQRHLSKDNLDDEIKNLVEYKLIPLCNDILGTQ